MEYSSDPGFKIRPAEEADLDTLTAIYNAAVTGTDFTGHLTPQTREERRDWWLSHRDRRYPVFVADQAGEVLGYASLSPWSPAPVYAQTVESSLYLAPGAQGRGLGTHMMLALLAEAWRLGHHVVISRIWAQNAASIAMCRKCGYEIVGVQREVGLRHGSWEDCVVMQALLPQ